MAKRTYTARQRVRGLDGFEMTAEHGRFLAEAARYRQEHRTFCIPMTAVMDILRGMGYHRHAPSAPDATGLAAVRLDYEHLDSSFAVAEQIVGGLAAEVGNAAVAKSIKSLARRLAGLHKQLLAACHPNVILQQEVLPCV